MILVDTSAWIEFFRGRGPFGQLVDRLLEADEVLLCGPVVTELRRGLIRPKERTRVLSLLSACPVLAQPRHIWEDAGDLGVRLARRGVIAKSLDLLIGTYALDSQVPLLTKDTDFQRMQGAGIPLDLIRP